MGKYHQWLELALKELYRDFCGGNFHPQNESDIKCHLYHLLLLNKEKLKGLTLQHIVLSEFRASPDSREKMDLAIARKTNEKIEPRLLLEIKETQSDHLPTIEIENRVHNDVDKLRRYKKELEESGNKKIVKPVILFFFRGAGKHRIGVETDDLLKQLKQKYDDVILEWGPR